MAYTTDLKSVARKSIRVRTPFPAPVNFFEEGKMANTDFKVGQTVYDISFGWGVVEEIESVYVNIPIIVKFPDTRTDALYLVHHVSYTREGKKWKEWKRTLFFAEPQIGVDCLTPTLPRVEDPRVGSVGFFGKTRGVIEDVYVNAYGRKMAQVVLSDE